MHRSNFRGAKAPRLPDLYRDAERTVERRVDQRLTDELSMLSQKLAVIDQRFDSLLRQTSQIPATTEAMRSKIESVGKLTEKMSQVTQHAQMLADGVRGLMPMRKNSENGVAMLNSLVGTVKDIAYRLDNLENQEPIRAEPSETQEIAAEAIVNYLKSDKEVIRDANGEIVGWKVASNR